ncbi:MAG: TonB-dependent receptor, partial [Saprospiraceae bacterium]|nr:TonB-dependent receptor [Saprospiraceae bacterium]
LLQTVVIQATRTGANSPVPHNNFSSGKITQLLQAQDVPFWLSSTPSLVESSDAGTGIGYTGMRIRGSDPTRINVTINGIPLNDAESQGVFWVDLPDLASSAAEIQVQRGVGVSTNGAGAFGATVNLDISRVQAEPFAVISNTLGSFNTRRHSIYTGTGLLGGKLAFSGRLSHILSDGYVDRAFANLKSYHLSGAFLGNRQSLQVHLLSGQERTYQAWYGLPAQYLDVDSLRRYNVAGTEKPGAPYADEVDDYTQRHILLHYKLEWTPQLAIQLNGHYTRGAGFYEQYKAAEDFLDYGLPQPLLGDSLLTQTDLIRRRWLDNHFYGGTFALRWRPGSILTFFKEPELLLGGAWSRYDGADFGQLIWGDYGVPKDFRYYDNDAKKLDANVYGKFEFQLRPRLTTLVDLQYRRLGYTFLGFDQNRQNVAQAVQLHFFNPKIGLNWAFHPNWTAYAFWGVAHREPNRDDYTQSTPASRPRPERLSNLESGVKINLNGWSLQANFYYMRYRDQLLLDGRINDVGAYIRFNVPDSYRAGMEVEAQAKLNHAFSLTGNLSWSRNKAREFIAFQDNWDSGGQDQLELKDTDLAFSPNLLGRLELTWNVLPNSKNTALAASFSTKYVGAQYLDNSSSPWSKLDAYSFSDLRINWNFKVWADTKISLILALQNLFDAQFVSNGWIYRYQSAGFDERPYNPYARLESGNVYHQAGYFPQAGRNCMGTLRLEF